MVSGRGTEPDAAGIEAILGDITVLELSEGVPGALCGKLLEGLGARVTKLEPPEGESGRRLWPFKDDQPGPERSGPFLYLNTAKRSITLNLRQTAGQELCRR